jgi:hypothetical protein
VRPTPAAIALGALGVVAVIAVIWLVVDPSSTPAQETPSTPTATATIPALAGNASPPATSGLASPAAAVASPAATGSAPTAPPPTTAVFRSERAEIGPVIWTTAVDPSTNVPRDRVTAYPAEAPALYAALPVTRISEGIEISATWIYNDTPIEGLNATIRADREQTDIWIEFHLTRSAVAAWPSGVYAVSITVDGASAHQATVQVGAPGT